jgi:soluble lytic murein transglycosylase-like protein
MRGSNLVVEFCTVLAAPVVVAGVSAFVCSSQVSAREHHGISHAHFSAHHVMPIAASNAAFGLGSFGQSAPDGVSAMPATMAAAQAGVPASLVARIIKRESGGNPRAVHAGNYGLMQIKLGYAGSAAGLLDPQTNMIYAVRYLAGAYRAAGGDENRAVALYARGYYAEAKARGFSPYAQ